MGTGSTRLAVRQLRWIKRRSSPLLSARYPRHPLRSHAEARVLVYEPGMRVATVRSLHRFPIKSMGGEALDSVTLTARGVPGDRIYALRDEARREIRGAKNWPELLNCKAWNEGDTLLVRMPDGTTFRHDDPALAPALSRLVGCTVTVCGLEPAENREHYRRRIPGSRLAGPLARSKTLARGLQRVMAATGADAELRQTFGREKGEPLPDLSEFPAEVFEFVSPLGTYFDAFPIHVVTSATLAAFAEKHPAGNWDAQRFRPNILLDTVPDLSGLVESGWRGRELHIGDAVLACTVPTPRCSMVLQAQPGLARDPAILRTIVRDADQMLGVYATVRRPGRIQPGDHVALV